MHTFNVHARVHSQCIIPGKRNLENICKFTGTYVHYRYIHTHNVEGEATKVVQFLRNVLHVYVYKIKSIERLTWFLLSVSVCSRGRRGRVSEASFSSLLSSTSSSRQLNCSMPANDLSLL